ncbi:hypothetical protein E8E11_000824 [Didymella keratinophila]|nr:hypothetical protein E8E11_000824 [Didymella keratinophila]
MSPFSMFVAFIFLSLVSADGETVSGRIGSGQCPKNIEAIMVYSPFKPYWRFSKFDGDMQKCWVATDCLFVAAGESRKQQFAATAFIMGLIPLSLKDIAWPERRIVHVSRPLPRFSEIMVLALGLVPLPAEKGDTIETRRKSEESNDLTKYAWRQSKSTIHVFIAVLAALLALCYTGLVFNEIYSKRSALRCVVPIFITAWHLVALLPASIHSVFADLRKARLHKMAQEHPRSHDVNTTGIEPDDHYIPLQPSTPVRSVTSASTIRKERERELRIVSAIQGADEDWPVQMAWVIYYIAGSLIFTSIMALTVIEPPYVKVDLRTDAYKSRPIERGDESGQTKGTRFSIQTTKKRKTGSIFNGEVLGFQNVEYVIPKLAFATFVVMKDMVGRNVVAAWA